MSTSSIRAPTRRACSGETFALSDEVVVQLLQVRVDELARGGRGGGVGDAVTVE